MVRFLSIRMFRLWNYLTFWQNVAFAACTKCWEANLFSHNNPYFTQNPKWNCVFLKIFFLIKKLILLWSTNLFERSFHLVENYLLFIYGSIMHVAKILNLQRMNIQNCKEHFLKICVLQNINFVLLYAMTSLCHLTFHDTVTH